LKTLIFFRHAKSDWGADYGADHERPLARRGVKAARFMGRFLQRTGQVPDGIVTSSAARARQTVELAAEAGAWEVTPRVTESLYGAFPQVVLREIHAEDDSTERLLLAGHEPTWSQMVGMMTGQANVRFPTAAMARIDFDVFRWSEVEFGSGTLNWLAPPKLLQRLSP